MRMPETKNTKNINIRVSQELMDKLDAWIKTQPTSPTRGQVVRMALRQLIAEEKGIHWRADERILRDFRAVLSPVRDAEKEGGEMRNLKVGNIDLGAAGIAGPTPDQIRKHGSGKQALVKIEMNGWFRDFAIFNPKLFLDDEDVRRTLMEQFEAELTSVITRGLAGKAPE